MTDSPSSKHNLEWALERVKTFDPEKGLMPYQAGMLALSAEIERLRNALTQSVETVRSLIRPDETSARQGYDGTRATFYCPKCQCGDCGNTLPAVEPSAYFCPNCANVECSDCRPETRNLGPGAPGGVGVTNLAARSSNPFHAMEERLEAAVRPHKIILCGAMGPSGFICERPEGHPGRHCDGDSRSWSPEKAPASHTTEQDFQHWLSYSGIASASEADLRAAFYAGANAEPPESGTPHGEAGDRAGPRVSPVDIPNLRQRMAELAGSLQHILEMQATPERLDKVGSLLSQLNELQKQMVVRPENGGR